MRTTPHPYDQVFLENSGWTLIRSDQQACTFTFNDAYIVPANRRNRRIRKLTDFSSPLSSLALTHPKNRSNGYRILDRLFHARDITVIEDHQPELTTSATLRDT